MSAYLDNAATTRVCPEAAQAAQKVMTEIYGNPSSTYALGRKARSVLDTSRAVIAGALGCSPSELYFTSCGSESDNWAVICSAEAQKRIGRHVITSAVEHDAVRKSFDRLESPASPRRATDQSPCAPSRRRCGPTPRSSASCS